MIPSFKLLVVGDESVGKRSLINAFVEAQNNFQDKSGALAGVSVHNITFATNFGSVKCESWVANYGIGSEEESASTTGQRVIPDEFYLHANCAILMFDVTARMSYQNVPQWFRNIVRVCDNIPVCMVGNKVDCHLDRKVKPKMITFHRRKNLQYYEVSAKANYNVEKPFLWLLKRLTCNPDLALVEAPALRPPEKVMTQAAASQVEAESRMANSTPVPDDDEDL